jgi:hypothetical protein
MSGQYGSAGSDRQVVGRDRAAALAWDAALESGADRGPRGGSVSFSGTITNNGPDAISGRVTITLAGGTIISGTADVGVDRFGARRCHRHRSGQHEQRGDVVGGHHLTAIWADR